MYKFWNKFLFILNRMSRRLFLMFESRSKRKFLFLLFVSVAFIVTIVVMRKEYAKEILTTTLGFLVGALSVYFMGALHRFTEDYIKVATDFKYLTKYGYDASNQIRFTFNGVEIVDYFLPTVINDECIFTINDHPKHTFVLDEIITNNYFTLLKSHDGSYKRNEITVRLNQVKIKDNKVTLELGRSDYFNHLVTNRALDYLFDGITTLRDVYEPGPFLHKYEDAKFSNHIGINGFLTLKHHEKTYLLISKRSGTSTISKGIVTSAVASRLIKFDLPLAATEVKIPFEAQVKKLYRQKFKHAFADENVALDFLGFGQDLYEAGKPQFYYALNYTCCDDSFTAFYQSIARRINEVDRKIDQDTKIIAIDLATLIYTGNSVFKARAYNGKRTKRVYFTVEKSFIANLYMYQASLTEQ